MENITMAYLPRGKDGCSACWDLAYYCNECTLKIVEHCNQEAAQPHMQGKGSASVNEALKANQGQDENESAG